MEERERGEGVGCGALGRCSEDRERGECMEQGVHSYDAYTSDASVEKGKDA